MLQPKKAKYKKMFRKVICGKDFRVIEINFGNFGIKAVSSGRIKASQLESAQKTMQKKIKGLGKIWLRFFPSVPVTSKPIDVRMGKGKGNVNYWCAAIHAGRVLFEFQGIPQVLAKELMAVAQTKLPIQVKLVSRM